MHRIVLHPAAEHLHRPLQNLLAPNQRLQTPVACQLGQIGGEQLQRRLALAPLRRCLRLHGDIFRILPLLLLRQLIVRLSKLHASVGDAAQQIVTGDTRLAHKIGAVRAIFIEDRHQNVGNVDLFAVGPLAVEHGPFNDTLETERLLRLTRLLCSHRHVLLQVGIQLLPHIVRLDTTLGHDASRQIEVERHIENMLRRQILMLALARILERRVQNGL